MNIQFIHTFHCTSRALGIFWQIHLTITLSFLFVWGLGCKMSEFCVGVRGVLPHGVYCHIRWYMYHHSNNICIVDDLHTTLPLTISQAIKSLNPCIIPSIEDTWISNASLNGEYSTRSGYHHWLISQREMESSQETWKLPMVVSIQILIW